MILGLDPLSALAVLAAGVIIGYFIRRWHSVLQQNTIEEKIKKDLDSAKSEAKDIVLEAKEKASAIVSDAQEEEKERKKDLRKQEERLLKKEDKLEEEREEAEKEKEHYEQRLEDVDRKKEEIEELKEKAVLELEEVAGLSKEKAKERLFDEIEEENKEAIAKKIMDLEKEKKEEVEKKSREIVTSAIQSYARDYVGDVTTSVVALPEEDMKGKVIGREGRNIRTFERLTGVELIVDEAPESIILSSFNPLRRELAKIALEKLLEDGRIQPAKIEEKVEEAREELDEHIKKAGEEAAYDVGILDLPKEILYLLGKLKYRTSYGQNVLEHSVEMAHISETIAGELGLKTDTVKKAALVHDIGKAVDHDVEGTHVEIGRKLLKKYGMDDKVIQAMEAHHEEYPFSTPESYIVAAADAISASRPGARRDTLDKYLKRLEEIEKVVREFDGVTKVYAVSAGREVRVFVRPEKVDDFASIQLAKKIANKLQSDIQYPGEIKVTVIREVKAVEYAR
ncbi:MAG TPA: ribonuclease Y [Candidatus Paceibacterota bacterium]|nr:ribonuclease Y [Candidatus Paceibacterota bacterium]